MLSKLSILAFASAVLAQTSGTVPTLAEALNSSTELTSLGGVLALPGLAQLVESLSNAQDITILAPSNAAFASIGNETISALTADEAMLTALLQYHVLNGSVLSTAITNQSQFVPTLLTDPAFTNVTGGQVVEAVAVDGSVLFFTGLLANSSVVAADVNFTGGVIHVIDRFLTLPESASNTLTAANLTSLRGALNTTNLLDAVDAIPDVTIFAPSNEAFQDIGSVLANASVEDTASILTYHVVNGTVGYSSGIENGTVLTTLNGQNLTITIGEEGRIFVNSALVTIADVLVANGVVHVIDQVLNPANATIADPTEDEGEVAFDGATPVADAPFASGQPTPTAPLNNNPADPADPAEASIVPSTGGAACPAKHPSAGIGAILGAAAIYALH